MTGIAMTRPPSATRWQTPVLIAVSLVLHALVLGYLALTAVGVDGPGPERLPRVYIPIQLEPRPLLPGEVARVQPPAPPRSAVTPAPVPVAGSTPTSPAPVRSAEKDDDTPSAPAPRAAAAPAGVPPAPASPWQVRPHDLGPGVARSLRTGATCDAIRSTLSRAEQVICDDRFGSAARAAAPVSGSGNASRDAGFAREGARALARYEARREPLSGGTGVVGPQDGPGSNFGMGVAGSHLDPSLRPDSTENIRTRRRDGPR